MRTLPLGTTGIDVSALCLGVMYFGTKTDEATSFAMLDQYVEAGGTFLDTANIYAHWAGGRGGDSERLLGKWLRQRRNRDKLFIASKVGFAYADVPISLHPRYIQQECEKSLANMGIDRIDLYYAHKDDLDTPMADTMAAFDKLVKAGKVGVLGASNFPAWRLAEAAATSRAGGFAQYCCVQQRHTYLRPRHDADFGRQLAANQDLLDYCRLRNVTMLAYSPLLKGSYVKSTTELARYAGADTQARLAVLNRIAAEKGATPNQVVLAWMLAGNPTVIPVFSASTSAQLSENLASLGVKLGQADMSALNSAGA
jgi:aryl-alcohol dehydrogenase-like predicted oxidoreductase